MWLGQPGPTGCSDKPNVPTAEPGEQPRPGHPLQPHDETHPAVPTVHPPAAGMSASGPRLGCPSRGGPATPHERPGVGEAAAEPQHPPVSGRPYPEGVTCPLAGALVGLSAATCSPEPCGKGICSSGPVCEDRLGKLGADLNREADLCQSLSYSTSPQNWEALVFSGDPSIPAMQI
jgi:hypothetical protein